MLDRIRHDLVGLKMPRALEALDGIVRRLEQGEVSALEAIDILLSEELTLRENSRIKTALRMGRLATIKTIAGFDFSFQPSLDRDRILTLAQLGFVARHEVVHFLGPPGTGKSHLATALGVEAVKAGRSVYFCTLADLIAQLDFTFDANGPQFRDIGASPSTADLGTGQSALITLTFNEAVIVGGTPTFTLNDGGTASYLSGSGSSALTFKYTVEAGQRTDDLETSSLNFGNGGSITDIAGNAAQYMAGRFILAGILIVDTTSPRLVGTSGNDILTASTTGSYVIDISAGGTDKVTGKSGGNTIVVAGASLDASDTIDTGTGYDTLLLSGDYSQGVTFSSTTVKNVEVIKLGGGFNYNLTTSASTVANGATLTMDGQNLGTINSVTLNGGAQAGTGVLQLFGGGGADVLIGGAGNDTIDGGSGADTLAGGAGADNFWYRGAYESPYSSSGFTSNDQITDFLSGIDKIDLGFLGLAAKGDALQILDMGTTGFSTVGTGSTFFTDNGNDDAVATSYNSATSPTAAKIYVNAAGSTTVGTNDLVIQLTGISSKLTVADFNF